MKIKRLIFSHLHSQATDRKVSLLLGTRQVGKTFLLRDLEQVFQKQGLSTRYFDLEQPADMLAFGTASESEQFAALTSADVVFVDEMHLLKNISHIFKAIHDSRSKTKIYATGSSALEMHKHLKESMAGRVIINHIYPLTLNELHQIPDYKDNTILTNGGLPGLVNCTSQEQIVKTLGDITATYIHRDIKGLVREENIRAFNHMLYLIAEQQGSIVVAANLANDIGVSKPTIENFTEILSQTYVCNVIPSYAKNMGNELKKSKKYYLYDLGIRNALLKDFRSVNDRPDAGILKESFVCLSIIKQLQFNMELRFWRTKQGAEVDFVVIKNRVPFPIEVKSVLPSPDIPTGLRKFLAAYPDAPGAIIFNDTQECVVSCENRDVHFKKWTEAEKIPFLLDVV